MDNKQELREYLLEQGMREDEIDEFLNGFHRKVTKDNLFIITIFGSAVELACDYVCSVAGELDHHIVAAIDYEKLGKELAESGDKYVALSSGRIVKFEL